MTDQLAPYQRRALDREGDPRSLSGGRYVGGYADEKAAFAEQEAERQRRHQDERERQRLEAESTARYEAEKAAERRRKEVEEAERYNARKAREAREEQATAEQSKRRAELTVDERAAAMAAERGVDFTIPKVPGSGWASGEFATLLLQATGTAQRRLRAMAEAQLDVDEARRALGSLSSAVQNPNAVSSLPVARDNFDVAEARFAVAYERLTELRGKLSDQGFMASLARCDQLHADGALDYWLSNDIEERAEIERAVAVLVEAIASLVAKHEQHSEKRITFNTLAGQLGLELSSEQRLYGLDVTRIQNWVAGIVGDAVRAGLTERGRKFEPWEWFPRAPTPINPRLFQRSGG